MSLDPNVWGPHYWFMLHTIAVSYPTHPNAVIKKKYYDFFQSLPMFLPDLQSSEYFTQLLDLYPVSAYLDSRKSMIEWTHFIHNKVNEKLEKPKISLSDFYTKYYSEYKPKTVKIQEYKRIKEKIIYFAVILLGVGIIYTTCIRE